MIGRFTCKLLISGLKMLFYTISMTGYCILWLLLHTRPRFLYLEWLRIKTILLYLLENYWLQVLDASLHYIDDWLLYSIWLLLHYCPRICTSEDLN